MNPKDIEIGELYIAEIDGEETTVRVESLPAKSVHTLYQYAVVDLVTGHKYGFENADRFLCLCSPSQNRSGTVPYHQKEQA